MSIFTEDQEAFLKEKTWAVLGTGRKDGSPQLSHIGYDWDGTDIIISIKSYTAKWKNALRQPKVSMLVHEDRKQLIIYGTTTCIDQDPDRAELTARVFRKLSGNPDVAVTDDFIKTMDEQDRTILRIRPDKAFMND